MHLVHDSSEPPVIRQGDGDTLGGRIWRARDAMNLSSRELADQLGVRIETISAWERDRSEPRTSRLFMLAGLLRVTPAWLIAGIGTAPADGLSQSPYQQLKEQLQHVKRLHEATGKAIAALELEMQRSALDLD